MPHTANGHNLEVIHMGYCRDCGGTSLIAGVQAQNVDAAPSPWIAVSERLPEVFDEQGKSEAYAVHIDNPFFRNGNYHVAYLEKSPFGLNWRGIEPNVHHGDTPPNVTHWMPLPAPPSNPSTD